MTRRVVAVMVAATLTACSSAGSPAADLQAKMNAVTQAANAKDATGLRTAVEAFLQEVTAQSQSGEITSTRAQDLRVVAGRLLSDATLLEPAPPVQTPAPSPSSHPSPSPSPPPSTPAPKPSPKPSPSAAPVPSPDLVPTGGGSASSIPAVGASP